MEMSEAKRKALTLPKPRKPSKVQIAAHSRYCTGSKRTVIMPDMPPYMVKAVNNIGRR